MPQLEKVRLHLYCSLSLTNVSRWDDAKLEAAEALIADPGYLKGQVNSTTPRTRFNHTTLCRWHRLARAYMGMAWLEAAEAVYRLALRSPLSAGDPANKNALEQGRRDVCSTQPGVIQDEFKRDVAPDFVARAKQLKEEGNVLVSSSPPDYDGACLKFTLAIALDPSSAILRCNRAYCANVLLQYDLAICDARVAIALDPSYAKAWARLSAALHVCTRVCR